MYFGHLTNRHANGHVSTGAQIGAVAPVNTEGNQGVAHVHLSARSGSGCNSSTKVPFDDAHGARFDGAPNLTSNGSVNQWAGTSLTRSGVTDADGDGVPDSSDRCPSDAGPSALEGCPDGDGDQTPDIDDRCVTEAGEVPNQGCAVEVGTPIDVNGDGRTDLVHRWSQGVNTWMSKGDGTYAISTQQAQPGYGYGDGTWMTGDVNGDGRTDLVHRWSIGVNTWMSRGDGTYAISTQQAQSGYGYKDGVWRVADVNGDGRTDLVHRWSIGVNTWMSKGDGTYAISTQQAHAGYGYGDGTWLDARADLSSIDGRAPTAVISMLKVKRSGKKLKVSLTASDVGAGIGFVQMRYRVAGSHAWKMPRAWQRLQAGNVKLKTRPSSRYCFSVRATDRADNISAWSSKKCVKT